MHRWISNKRSEESEELKYDAKKFIEYIENESKGTNYDLFKDYFNFLVSSVLPKQLFETKNKKKNNTLVEEIKNRWSNLKDEAEKCLTINKKLNNKIE